MTVSRRIQALESKWAPRCLLREGSGYKLTDAGRQLQPRADHAGGRGTGHREGGVDARDAEPRSSGPRSTAWFATRPISGVGSTGRILAVRDGGDGGTGDARGVRDGGERVPGGGQAVGGVVVDEGRERSGGPAVGLDRGDGWRPRRPPCRRRAADPGTGRRPAAWPRRPARPSRRPAPRRPGTRAPRPARPCAV